MSLLGRLIDPFWSRARRKLMMLVSNQRRIAWLRKDGVRIGENCIIYTTFFSTEPYLVKLGDHVAVSSGTSFITHDASPFLFEDHPDMDVFGDIEVGDNTFIGIGCVILPATRIGKNCVVGAGSVVRGRVPDDSVVFGNPARVILKTAMMKKLLVHHRHRLDTRHLDLKTKEKVLRKHFGLEK